MKIELQNNIFFVILKHILLNLFYVRNIFFSFRAFFCLCNWFVEVYAWHLVNKCFEILTQCFSRKNTASESLVFKMSLRRSFQNVLSRFLTSESTNIVPANIRRFSHPSSGQVQSPKPYTIIVEGNIGSGKTTFLEPFTKSHQDQV